MKKRNDPQRELERLRAELAEVQETLRAIREGEIDALVTEGPSGHEIFTLQSADRPYRLMIEQMQDAAVMLNAEGRILYMNRRLSEMLRESPESLLGTAFLPHVAEDRRPAVTALLRETGTREDLALVAADGTVLPARISAAALDGDPTLRLCLVITDLSEKKRVEQIFASERYSRAILNQAADAIAVCDASGKLTFANAAARALGGLDPDAPASDVERTFLMADGSIGPFLAEVFKEALERRATMNQDRRLLRADGTTCDVRFSAIPLRDGGGKVIGAVATFSDITARKMAEDALRDLNETLEKRVAERTVQLHQLIRELAWTEQRERTQLALVLHDNLQQIVAAARMRLEMAIETLGGAPGAPQLEQVYDLLGQAIDGMRTLSVELNPPVLNERGLWPALEWLAEWMTDKHGLRVDLTLDPAAPGVAAEDALLVFQAARELLFNVVKHAGTREAWVRVQCAGAGPIRIVVEDHGKGFDSTHILSQDTFGLSTIRQRLRVAGGDLEIETAPGRGVRAELLLPRSEDEAAAAAAGAGRLKILLADDHPIVRDGLAALLSERPELVVVGQAEDGLAAVESARLLRPDVVIMDVSMPKLDGIEATRRILSERPTVRVIGLSNYDQIESKRAMYEAGAVGYLSKDGPPGDLVQSILETCGLAEQPR